MQDQSAVRSEGVNFVNLPLVKPNTLEERKYQLEVAEICYRENTLAVLPTGLGKTAIALLMIAHCLSSDGQSRALILAPTRVLVHQHHSFLASHLDISPDEIGVLTGEDGEENRKDVWAKRVVCATPQVTVSDVEKKICKVEDFYLIIFDEAHRAIGNYAYTTIASIYNEFNPQGRILGMTASLPSDKVKIEEIISKLKIKKVEIRDEKSEDVKPYIFKTDIDWIELELAPDLKTIQGLVRDALNSRLRLLEEAQLFSRTGANKYNSISLKDLLRLRTKVDQIHSAQLRNALFSSIRLFHALNLIETQSLSAFTKFMERLLERKRGYGMGELLNDQRVKEAYESARGALLAGKEHPKIEEVLKLAGQIRPGERAIIFASYRDTVEMIYSELQKKGFRAGYLIGKSGEGGQSQKNQLRALHDLREGYYDILVATQVGEEGLDVAECNLVIFYDNVPSAVRYVQRKGRTGRRREGHIYALIAKGTRDEAYYWLSRRRVGDAKKIATEIMAGNEKRGPLDPFLKRSAEEDNSPLVFVDTREIPELVEKLRHKGARVEVKQLDFGDFVVSSDVVIERKTLDDFVKSIFDGRLFNQLANMGTKYSRPLLIIQGSRKDLSGMSESAFYGALASVLADFKVPIFFAINEKEVAEIVFHIARREQLEKKREVRLREGKKPVTVSENQRYVVSGIPGVNAVLADRLLSHLETVEKLFSATELDLMKIDGIGEVTAKRIRELATAKYVPATPGEIKKMVTDESTLEGFAPNQQVKKDETKNTDDDDDLSIPPPPED